MSATLGGLLKDYRLQKGLSQMEISFELGWKEPSRLSRIEQGKVGKPKRELLEKVMQIMRLEEEDKNHLLLVGNYLPTKQEVEKIRRITDPILQKWEYPVVVYDFSWRIIHENDANIRIFRKSKKQAELVRKNTPWMFELEYDPELPQNKYLKDKELEKWHDTLRNYLVHFKYVQRTRTKERWYIDIVKKMMKNDLFRKLWKEAQASDYSQLLKEYARVTATPPENPNIVLHFDVFNVPLLKEPRVDVELHVPADLETFNYFQKK